uniref:Uncharacterized protein n=1 Tax=Oryza brachyantha TaxID=4533 RepID=J3LH60_ORYBR
MVEEEKLKRDARRPAGRCAQSCEHTYPHHATYYPHFSPMISVVASATDPIVWWLHAVRLRPLCHRGKGGHTAKKKKRLSLSIALDQIPACLSSAKAKRADPSMLVLVVLQLQSRTV